MPSGSPKWGSWKSRKSSAVTVITTLATPNKDVVEQLDNAAQTPSDYEPLSFTSRSFRINGTYKAEYPPDDVTVSYSSRVYPEIDVQELLKHAAEARTLKAKTAPSTSVIPSVARAHLRVDDLSRLRQRGIARDHCAALNSRGPLTRSFSRLFPKSPSRSRTSAERRVFRKWLKEGTARGTIQ